MKEIEYSTTFLVKYDVIINAIDTMGKRWCNRKSPNNIEHKSDKHAQHEQWSNCHGRTSTESVHMGPISTRHGEHDGPPGLQAIIDRIMGN